MNWSDKEKKNEILILVLLNISVSCYLLFSLAGIIAPLAVWIFTRERYPRPNQICKKLLNFQITCCLLISDLFAMMFIIPTFHLSNNNTNDWTMMFMVLLSGINIFFIILNKTLFTVKCILPGFVVDHIGLRYR